MNRMLYIQQTIRLLKLYVDGKDYKTAFFILINAMKNMDEEWSILLANSFPKEESESQTSTIIEKN